MTKQSVRSLCSVALCYWSWILPLALFGHVPLAFIALFLFVDVTVVLRARRALPEERLVHWVLLNIGVTRNPLDRLACYRNLPEAGVHS